MKWYIEECIFDNTDKFESFKEYLKIFQYAELITKEDAINEESQICTLCSLSSARDLGFYQSIYWNVSTYARYLKDEYLNNDFIILPSWKYKESNLENKFVKSDSGFKYLTGDVFISNKDIIINNDDINLIISSAKNIEEIEYRFWIINGRIIAKSSYSWNDNQYYVVPKSCTNYVKNVIKNIPNIEYPVFTIDIVMDMIQGKWKVVEINNIFTSGLYNADDQEIAYELEKYCATLY